jgi:hypothetical protein
VYQLSKQNCDEIFGVTDVEKLADSICNRTPENFAIREVWKDGFNKAMELNGGKLFTIDDMHEALHLMNNTPRVPIEGEALEIVRKETEVRGTIIDKVLRAKQPTEIKVNVEMMQGMRVNGIQKPFPVKDSNGCLILKKPVQ